MAVLADEDQRHARRAGPITHHVINIDSRSHKTGDRFVSEHVLANPGDKGDRPARPCRTHRLVGPFAAGCTGEFTTNNGLARFRQALHFDDHVGVRAADDDDRILGLFQLAGDYSRFTDLRTINVVGSRMPPLICLCGDWIWSNSNLTATLPISEWACATVVKGVAR